MLGAAKSVDAVCLFAWAARSRCSFHAIDLMAISMGTSKRLERPPAVSCFPPLNGPMQDTTAGGRRQQPARPRG